MAAETASEAFRASLPVALTVCEVRRENEGMVTLFFPAPDRDEAAGQGLDLAAFVPGRFFMAWLPRLDEKPYAVSYLDEERLGITVQPRGPFSRRLAACTPGDLVGLRGPFGRGFWDLEANAHSPAVAIVGGGCGMAVLAPLAEALPGATLVQGARTAGGLLYRDRFPGQVVFTDDGSAGRRGFPTDWVAEEAAAGRVEMAYACGPEPMLAALASACRDAGVNCQVSLERYMKCGVGVCGQCECDGRRVCEDGPTFRLDELARMPSFGRMRRDATGAPQPVEAGAGPPAGDSCPAGPSCDAAGG